MYRDGHAKIRADPTREKKPKNEDVKPKRWVTFAHPWLWWPANDVIYLLLLKEMVMR